MVNHGKKANNRKNELQNYIYYSSTYKYKLYFLHFYTLLYIHVKIFKRDVKRKEARKVSNDETENAKCTKLDKKTFS